MSKAKSTKRKVAKKPFDQIHVPLSSFPKLQAALDTGAPLHLTYAEEKELRRCLRELNEASIPADADPLKVKIHHSFRKIIRTILAKWEETRATCGDNCAEH